MARNSSMPVVRNCSGVWCVLSAIWLRQIDLLSRPKDSALPGLYIGRYSPQPQSNIERIDAERGPERKLTNPMLLRMANSAQRERRSDRQVSSRRHHRFRYAHARRLRALLCRRLRRGADGQKLGAAPAYASLARACGALGCGGCGGRASVLGIASAFVFRRRVMWIGPSRANPPDFFWDSGCR